MSLTVLPQTWIVLTAFILYVIFNLFMTFFNKKYRQEVFKNKYHENIMYGLNIIVLAIVMAYSVQCSIQGSYVMPSCNVFTWILTTLILIMFIFNVFSRVYTYVIKGKKEKNQNK